MNQVNKLACLLSEVEQARMALRRTRDILDSIRATLEVDIDEIHNSEEYQENVKKQILEDVL